MVWYNLCVNTFIYCLFAKRLSKYRIDIGQYSFFISACITDSCLAIWLIWSMSMSIWVTEFMSKWVYSCICVCVHAYTCAWVFEYMGTWVYVYMGIWVHGYMGTWVYGYMSIWVHEYMCQYVDICGLKSHSTDILTWLRNTLRCPKYFIKFKSSTLKGKAGKCYKTFNVTCKYVMYAILP